MTQDSWSAWVKLGFGLSGPFIEDVTIYDCLKKPGYQRATITLDQKATGGDTRGKASSSWRPIAEAPRDGRDVLLCGNPKRYGRPHWIDHWDDAHECWFHCRYSQPAADILAWMPLTLPASPAEGEKT